MDDPGARRHRGELFAALAAMGFGSAYAATAFALEAFEPVSAAAWRSVVATIAVGALLLARRARQGSSADPGPSAAEASDLTAPGPAARAVRLLVLAILAGPLFLASMNLAVAGSGAAIAAFVAGLYAVLSAVIAPLFLPERLAARTLAGFLLALGGTALLSELDPSGASAAGVGWGLVAAGSFAVYLVLARRWSRPYRLDGHLVALVNCAVAAAVLGGLLLLVHPASLVPTAPSLAALAGLGWTAVVAALGPVLTIAAVRLIPAARSAAFLLLNPITATGLAVLLLGELPTPVQALGGVLVLLGMAVAIVPTRVGTRNRPRP